MKLPGFLYRFVEREQMSPGAEAFAFMPSFGLPVEPIGGAGDPYKEVIVPFMGPNIMYGQDQFLDGLPGTQAEDYGSQELVDMDRYLENLQSAGAGLNGDQSA